MTFLAAIQAIIGMLLSICILLQHRASGLSATFGGGGATYVQRRGAEKLIFRVAVWLGFLFFFLAVIQWYV
ncbi:preprotein translocase subunit SecG [Candidatus Peribacteria bacterium RIFCSPHIGHO2_01_FULL_51_9]|nr:MAG: preprotein translocase subunit SecG [Candidatus Peribacteria bacterium RIFCSPHIGHO2_01_FULL_51_9]